MTAHPLSIAQILDQPALMPLWPNVGQALMQAESTIYQLAKEGRLPFEVIRLGRRRYARTVDVQRWLGLLPDNNEAAPGATGTASSEQPTQPA
ncbi:helix-turn-helix transcriptional regulator [Streptomyces sp. NRRL F-5630]|uniref:helix-turn-helix transcriptional regulator n=1 Tax=Streptomyces sp. NRRL F-5630 TaxID=1463864 RepID=UPI003D7216AC